MQATPGTPLYRALVQAGLIAASDGPEPFLADVAAIAYLGGYALGMGIGLALDIDPVYSNALEQSDFDFIVSEVQLYKPSYTYDTSTLWSPNWEDYFDLLDELYETQLGYVETAENSICAPEYAPYSEELLERARSGIEFTSGIDGILNQNDDLIDQQLENAYEDYRAEGGDLTFEDWVAQGMPEASSQVSRYDQLSTDPQTGRITPDDRVEADAILEAERLGYVQNARRPNLSMGEPNLDFKVDGGWADVKTPVSSPYRTLSQQAEDIATKSNLYDSDVKVILNLRNLDSAERNKFIEDLEAAGADMSKIHTVF